MVPSSALNSMSLRMFCPPRWFAVDTGTDRQRDGAALVAEPGRDHGAEAAGGTAGCDDKKLIGRFHCRVFAVAAIAHHRALADLRPFAAPDARSPVNERRDVALAPIRGLQVFAQLLRDDQRV